MTVRALAALLLLSACKEEQPSPGPAPAKPIVPRSPARAAPAPARSGFDGFVVGRDGAPVAAKLWLTAQGRDAVAVATDGSGKFSAPDLADGEWGVDVRARDEVPTHTAVYLPQHGYTLKMDRGDGLTLTTRLHLHDPDPDGMDGPQDGPLLEEATLDVWWQARDATWEKIQTVEVKGHRAEVRVPRGEVYLELSALGRCGANFLVTKGDLAEEIALDGEAALARIVRKGGKPLDPGWEVTVVPLSPTHSACLRRTAKPSADGALEVPTTGFASTFTVELKEPGREARALPGKATGGHDFRITWGDDGPLLR